MSNRQTFISLLLAATLSIVVGSVSEIVGLAQPPPQSRATGVVYECPMHPEVTSKKRGRCSKCGMTLQARKEKEAPKAATTISPLSKKSVELVSTTLRIPDAMVLDQNGRPIKFYSDLVKNKTVAINFIFTTCTAICPTLTATFRRLQQELGERAGRNVHLISISVDPTTDVPERLKDYSLRFKAGPGWTFVTGSKSEIDELLRALGASAPNKNDHTPMALIGNDRAGYWTRTYGAASPSSLLKTINEAASKQADIPSGSSSNGSEAPGQASVNIESQSASASYFPNLVLRTQEDKPVHFYDDLLKGKVVLINFLFTNCQGVCSPMTANLARAQSYLAEHLDKEVVMISISVDPLTDTPEVLKKYAEKFKVKSGWYFLTGEKKNVDWVLYKLGGYVTDKQQHTSVLIVGNEATGEWLKINAMATPTDIASAVTKLLVSKPDTATP